MKTESIKNRDNAFVAVIEKIPQKKQLIYQLIKENEPCTAWDIATKYLIPINEVVGRITNLKDECLLIEVGSKENNYTRKQNTLYRAINNQIERIALINQKYGELITKKDELLNDYHLGLSNLTRQLVDKELKKIQKQIKQLENILETH